MAANDEAANGARVYLVDGTFELFRCFHGAPPARHAGREVGAARGLLWSLTSLLRREPVTHVAVAFDSIVANVSGLPKGSRERLLRSQAPLAAEVCRALGLLIWPMSRFQADDALATGAARFGEREEVAQLVICSNDNDFAQCVRGERVILFDRNRKLKTDEAGVREKFGVEPRQIPEYLALVGDRSDGLPGIPGWGPKSTAEVLARYPSVEEIPDDVEDWEVRVRGAAKLAASLADRRREALLYRNLSVLRTDVPLPDELEHLEWQGARPALLDALLEVLGGDDHDDLRARIERWQE